MSLGHLNQMAEAAVTSGVRMSEKGVVTVSTVKDTIVPNVDEEGDSAQTLRKRKKGKVRVRKRTPQI